MVKKTPLVWALVDDRVGNTSQVLGVAEALGIPFIIKNVIYNRLGRLPSSIKMSTSIGLSGETKKELLPPWPDIVISVARRMESAALYIKRKSPKTKLVHIQKPESPLHKFDLIVAPEHDFTKNKTLPSNVLLTIGAPNRINPEVLENGARKWEKVWEKFSHPRVAVLLGGDTKRNKFTRQHAHELASGVNSLLEKIGKGSLLVTTSRRTPIDVIEMLKEEFKEPKYFYDYRDGGANPYAGLLACADAIVVTGDSVSMCSEACTSGKPTYIYSPDSLVSPKQNICQQKLIAKGYARSLGDEWGDWNYTPLADSKMVAEYIKSNLV